MRRRLLVGLVLAAMMLTTAAPAVAHGDHDRKDRTESEYRQLKKIRHETAKFHSIRRVERAGYRLGYIAPFLLDGCIAHPTEGAMGFHWFNHDMIHDTELDPLRPEGIVYAPTRRGQLRLAAVEWIVPRDRWEAEGNVGPPELLGQELHILNEPLGWYILHAWVWKYNPSGVFSDWNPRVDCG